MSAGRSKTLMLSSRRPRQVAAEERGAEIVEFAIVAPLLLTLIIGIVWLGRAYNVYQTITRAAREGARFAVAPSCSSCGNTFPTDAEIKNVINGALTASSLDPSQVNPPITIARNQVLNPSDPSSSQVSGVVISFGYPFQFVIPFTSLTGTKGKITINTKVQMRQEF
ncbi:MAG TPA: TadE/TadG family type IV pilus assembly protein [Candidatus Acidoferrales bacterium]|nr:TadE/TadG family type IV pilus assembly protein [Candidatus Acidoferrales bacterium]